MAKVMNNFHLFGNLFLRKLNVPISLLLNCKTILVFVFVMIGGVQIDDQGGGLDTQPTAANLAILLAAHFLLWPLLNTHNVNSRHFLLDFSSGFLQMGEGGDVISI